MRRRLFLSVYPSGLFYYAVRPGSFTIGSNSTILNYLRQFHPLRVFHPGVVNPSGESFPTSFLSDQIIYIHISRSTLHRRVAQRIFRTLPPKIHTKALRGVFPLRQGHKRLLGEINHLAS